MTAYYILEISQWQNINLSSVSLGTLVPNSRDQQGKLWLLNVFGKQPYNNISFKYKP